MERGWQAASDLGASSSPGVEPGPDHAPDHVPEHPATAAADGVLASWTFGPDADAPGAARSLVGAALAGRDADLDVILLMVSELVTNAVLHTRRDAELRLMDLGDDGYRFEVEDRDGHIPTPSESPGARGGFGLRIIDTFARSWGTTVFDGRRGKVVWFEVDAGNRSP